ELGKQREVIERLQRSLKEKTERIDELQGLESEIQQLHERFEAQRETIMKMHAEKLSKDGTDELPTLTTKARPGGRAPG
ncbi:MAG: hypothetical protein OEQ74_10225, partial [Gammaproteobacteria bacterium]|nr:hypothetical protein [Gammaproteobacteria bacterium]